MGDPGAAPSNHVAGRCPVCGTPIGTGLVVKCARCNVPHHADCIEYAGGCAIYGCAGSDYRVAGAAVVRTTHGARPQPVSSESDARGYLPQLKGHAIISFPSPSLLRPVMVVGTGLAWLSIVGLLVGLGYVLPRDVILLLVRILVIGKAAAPLFLAIAGVFLGPLFMVGELVGRWILGHDNSLWAVDLDEQKLLMLCRVGSTTLRARSVDLGAVASIAIGPLHQGSALYLSIVRTDGTRLDVLDDMKWHTFGYDEPDLVRIGQRLGKALNVPCREVPMLPERTA